MSQDAKAVLLVLALVFLLAGGSAWWLIGGWVGVALIAVGVTVYLIRQNRQSKATADYLSRYGRPR